jgi:hypothetical protein
VFKLNIDKSIICPECQGKHFSIKREATYLYSYKLNTPETEQWSKEKEALPFLFDYREKTNDREYLECEDCHAKFPCSLDLAHTPIDFTILQKAVRSEFAEKPDFLG